MGLGIPAGSAKKLTTLEENHRTQAWSISTAGGNQRVTQHDRPPSVLALVLLGYLAGVICGLLPLHLQHVAATEVVRDLLAALACKAIQINGGISSLINGDRNRLLLHGDLPPCDKLESHLLTFRGVDYLTVFQGVTLRPGHGQGLLFFVDLLNAANPPGSIAAVFV
jgi:hypothetical protein